MGLPINKNKSIAKSTASCFGLDNSNKLPLKPTLIATKSTLAIPCIHAPICFWAVESTDKLQKTENKEFGVDIMSS